MIRKRAAERKPTVAPPPSAEHVNNALHAMNTFPKAFFVWGIIDRLPQRPKEMEERLQRDFPFLQEFPFLNRNNFNQYCQRSLKYIIERESSPTLAGRALTLDDASDIPDIPDGAPPGGNGALKDTPFWRLADVSIKPAAGFLLAKCVAIGVNCEGFLSTGRNSCPQSNQMRISLLQRLGQFVSQTVDRLAEHLEADTTTIDRHLVKMAAAGLIEYHVPATDGDIRKRAVKGAYARITAEGQAVAREILPPILSYLRGESRFRETVENCQPTREVLLRAMEVYAESIAVKAA